jgi:glycosyltransferase involved in cell wall biosynthesis
VRNTKKNLYLFTANYPYGTGEDYVHNELKVIHKFFNTIYIIPDKKDYFPREAPANNIKVIPYTPYSLKDRSKILIRNLHLIFKLLVIEILKNKNRWKILNNFKYYIDVAISYAHKYNFISNHLSKNKTQAVFYSFWMHDWATALSITKAKGIIDKFVCRVNGFDFREEMAPNGFIFPRQYQLRYVDKVHAVSEFAYNQLCNNHPSFSKKFTINKLGVFDKGINPPPTKGAFTIVSCSMVTHIKRVDLIPKILKSLNFKTHWIHFGDGPLLNRVKEACRELPKHITFDLKGYTKNEDVISFYKKNHVDLFIQLSTHEGGVPVALQEAASFGIPILATEAGGIPEIVNKKSGFLIPCHFSSFKVARILEEGIPLLPRKRKHIRETFCSNYNAEKNYTKFALNLTNSEDS